MSRKIIDYDTNNHEMACLDINESEKAFFLLRSQAKIWDREFYHIKILTDKICHSNILGKRNRPTSRQTILIAFRTLFRLRTTSKMKLTDGYGMTRCAVN